MSIKTTPLDDFKYLCEYGYIQLQGWLADTVALDCIDNVESALKEQELLNEENVGLRDKNAELAIENSILKKTLKIISQNFRLVGNNILHAKNEYSEDGWVFVKEIEDEEELKAWKEVLWD